MIVNRLAEDCVRLAEGFSWFGALQTGQTEAESRRVGPRGRSCGSRRAAITDAEAAEAASEAEDAGWTLAGRSGSAHPSHAAAVPGPPAQWGGSDPRLFSVCCLFVSSEFSSLSLKVPTERFWAVLPGSSADVRLLSIPPELQFPAFPPVNPADEVILEEVNLQLYTSVCTSSLRRRRREIRRSLRHAGRRRKAEKTSVGDKKDLDAIKSADLQQHNKLALLQSQRLQRSQGSIRRSVFRWGGS